MIPLHERSCHAFFYTVRHSVTVAQRLYLQSWCDFAVSTKGWKGFIRDALLNPQSKCDAWILRKGGRDSRIYELAWGVIYVKSSRFPWNLEHRKRFKVFRFIKRRMNFSLSRAWNKNMQKRLTPLLEATVLGLSPIVNTAWVKPDDQPGLKRNFALPASWRTKWNEIWSIPMAS